MSQKRFGKIILIGGIALLFVGIGLAIYGNMFAFSTLSATRPVVYNIPVWFANVVAVALAILGIFLIFFGVNELDPMMEEALRTFKSF